MTELTRPSARRFRGTITPLAVFLLIFSVSFGLLFSQVAEAASHRARMSKDLEARLAAGTTDTSSVIVMGSDAEVQALVARYGARLKKAVRGGAVLEVTGAQLSALSEDPAVTHLSGDAQVQRMMAVTTESTGQP